MKKVGLLTFHFADNIGALLSTYALQSVLQKIGMTVSVINFIPPMMLEYSTFLPSFYRVKYECKSYFDTFRAYFKHIASHTIDLNGILKKHKKCEEFRQRYLNITEILIRDLGNLKKACESFDACIVGGDQVWNPRFLELSNFGYLLPFKLKNALKIAYAASIAEKIPQNQLNIFRECVHHFSAVSVRERSSSSELTKLLGREIYHVLDPTLLMEKSDYANIIKEPAMRFPSRYILTYNVGKYLNNPIFSVAKKMSNKIGIPVVTIGFSMKNHCYVGPSEFLWLLENAEYVITNSYHGMLLSIVFQKRFIVVPPSLGSLRVIDFIEEFNLRENNTKIIDYKKLCKFLSESKAFSINFLRKALEQDNYQIK
ncbi:MAG: polysaccharide pyruvyl transferase family protein [Candidatus Bathyarchaeia archaeon]